MFLSQWPSVEGLVTEGFVFFRKIRFGLSDINYTVWFNNKLGKYFDFYNRNQPVFNNIKYLIERIAGSENERMNSCFYSDIAQTEDSKL